MSKKPKDKPTRGRPSLYTPERAEEICEWISQGKTLRDWCRQSGVKNRTVYEWREAHEDFAARFARARDLGFDALAEETLAIADDTTNDFVTATDASGKDYEKFNAEHVQRSKLRIQTRLDLLAKWDPRRYGNKIEHSGTVGTYVVEAPAEDQDSTAWERGVKG